MSHRVLKYWLLCSKVISSVTPQDNNRATASDVLRLRTLRRCSTVPPTPGPIKQPLSFVLFSLSCVSFFIVPSLLNFPPIAFVAFGKEQWSRFLCNFALCPVTFFIVLRPKFRSAVISYCNTENSVVHNINWRSRLCCTQLLISVLQIRSCTTCFGLFTCRYLHLWSAILLLYSLCKMWPEDR
jgi:hypothetical protein